MTGSAVRITFVRHGESVSNRVKRWQGQGDSPLSDLGREQARAVGARLARRRFDRVISSDLSRAADTARATGFELEIDRDWREFDVGVWEGLTREEVLARYPEEMTRLRNGEDIPMGGGESYATFAARIDRALDELLSELTPGQHALVVCHGGVIGSVLSRALGLRGRSRWPLWRASNTSITELSYGPEGALLHVFNDTLHLAHMSPWPSFEDLGTCVALLSESTPHEQHGDFAAHYEGVSSFEALARASHEDGVGALSSVIEELSTRHPASRVALSVRSTWIRAWIEDALWRGAEPEGRIVDPPEGALSHVAYVDGRPQVLDFGLHRL